MSRVVALLVAPLLLSSCLWPILGEPGIAMTNYVITGSASDARRAEDVIRHVAAANGLRLFTEAKQSYRYREYRNRDAHGLASLTLSVDPRRPLIISVTGNSERPTPEHRKIAHDIEIGFTEARIAFHKPSPDELVRLKEERFKKET